MAGRATSDLEPQTGEGVPAPKRRAAHTATRVSQGATATMVKDAERTRAEIIEVATAEFSLHGYSGGRINEIAERTRTSKRMLYYYFGSKEGLYRAVLYEHYRRLRAAEGHLHLAEQPPIAALRSLVHFTFDWYVANAGEAPLIMVENIHQGVHIRSLPNIERLNSGAIDLVKTLYERGIAEGVMRPGLRPIDIYLIIASASFFNISNRYTFAAIFDHDMTSPSEIALRREALTDTVLRYVALNPSAI
ncbi:MAG: TetR/AcrR family transcriptional regulator [Caulobacteraceae bacterium]|nr:TetR/AcrR family transcriptional regulator [Caulobacteraceae bacterium]